MLLQILFCKVAAQATRQIYYRADEEISFQWRYGYSEFPFPAESAAAREDALRGKFGWCDGALWSQAYKSWNDSIIHGVPLLFRGGSPYARSVKCTSQVVPYEAAGTPVSFLLPFQYTIGSEEDIAWALSVKGAGEETIVCKLRPQPAVSFTGGMFKIHIIALKVTTPAGPKPLVSVAGIMLIRVYPPLVAYGNRMEFIFSSVTHHMDVESSLIIGSIYKDMSSSDPYQLAARLIELVLKDLPAAFRNVKLKITQWYNTPDEKAVQEILSQNRYYTLPLTRGSDRYEKDFLPEEVTQLNQINIQTDFKMSNKNSLSFLVGIGTYGLRLIQIEPASEE